MSTNGETADLMVREGIQITESALKLAGLGAKNLAALLIALANDNQKLAGKTNLKRLIHDGEELTIFSVKQEDLKGFQMEAKRYGVLFYPIVNKVEKTGTVEIMAKARDAKQINRIFERMGYPAPVKEDTAAKKENARAPSENSSKERGTGARASTEPATEKADARPSVRSRLMALQAAAERDGTAPTKDTVRETIQKANVAIAGHNRGVNNHFGKIHTLDIGDTIKLTTQLGTRSYEVYSVSKIGVDDTSVLNDSTENIITLVTCVKNQPDYRWCVQARVK